MPPSPTTLVVLLAVVGLLNSLGSDMLIPALPALRADLGITPWQAQQTISLFFVASACTSLWYGAIADACGRRTTIITSLLLLALAAAASVLPMPIERLWLLRVVQGVAAGAGMVLSRLVLHDIHSGLIAQRLLSRMMFVQTLSLIATPLLGAWLAVAFGWRAVFVALAAIALLLAAVCWWRLPETLAADARRPFRAGALWRAYREVLRAPSFMRLSLAHVANWTALATYVVAAPAVVIHLLGRSATEIYLVYAPVTLGLTLGFWAFPKLAPRLGAPRLQELAYAILAAAVAANLGLSLAVPAGRVHVLPLFVYAFGMSLVLPLLVSGALQSLPARAGVAASCQTFLQLALMAAAAGLFAPLLWDSLFRLAVGTAALTALGAACLLHERRAQARLLPSLTAAKGDAS